MFSGGATANLDNRLKGISGRSWTREKCGVNGQCAEANCAL